MSDQNLFTEVNPATQPNEPSPTVDKYADLLKSIRNEAGEQKYKSLDDALVALQHSQEYIPSLKTTLSQKEEELGRIKAELEKRASIEEVVSRLAAKRTDEGGSPPMASGLDEQAVAKLVEQQILHSRAQEAAKSNQERVQKILVDKFGEKAGEHVRTIAQSLGWTKERLGALATESPEAALKLLIPDGSYKTPHLTVNGNRSVPKLDELPEIAKPTKSLLSGANSKEQTEFMLLIKDRVYAKNGVTK